MTTYRYQIHVQPYGRAAYTAVMTNSLSEARRTASECSKAVDCENAKIVDTHKPLTSVTEQA